MRFGYRELDWKKIAKIAARIDVSDEFHLDSYCFVYHTETGLLAGQLGDGCVYFESLKHEKEEEIRSKLKEIYDSV